MLKTENDEKVTSADLTAVLHISSAGYRLCVLEDTATALPSKSRNLSWNTPLRARDNRRPYSDLASPPELARPSGANNNSAVGRADTELGPEPLEGGPPQHQTSPDARKRSVALHKAVRSPGLDRWVADPRFTLKPPSRSLGADALMMRPATASSPHNMMILQATLVAAANARWAPAKDLQHCKSSGA